MQLEKSELATSKDYDYEGISRVKTEELEELKWEKKHEDILYKILKYNPIDAINDVYHDIIDKLNLTDLEQRLQWWAAYIYVKFVLRALWNFKVKYPKRNPAIMNRVLSANSAFRTGLVRINVDKCESLAEALEQQVYDTRNSRMMGDLKTTG